MPTSFADDVHYDLIVIGAGQCGNPLASAFHAHGKRVAVIERDAVGGTCVNYGCTPTKTMVASAEVASLARRAHEFGIRTGEVSVDMRKIVDRKGRIVATSRTGSEKKFEMGISLFRGTGSFLAPRKVRVRLAVGGERVLTAPTVVIDTGLSPAIPELKGIDDVRLLNNASIMELEEVPAHLLVLGGGYVGLEFAQMFRRFGSRVSIVHRGARLLDHEDDDVRDEIASLLRDDGIELHLNAQATTVEMSGSAVRVQVKHEDSVEWVEGSHVLNAAGRKPNTADLNLSAAGVEADEYGYIRVNERLETTTPGIYAVGDVKGGPAFTHISYDDFRILKANLLDNAARVTTGRPLPYCVFIDPQLGRVGLTEKEALRLGRAYKVARIDMTWVARAFETEQTRGFMKALVDPDSGEILGAAILSADGGEIMSMLQIAMMAKMPYSELRDAIFAHPTFAESLNTLFTSLDR